MSKPKKSLVTLLMVLAAPFAAAKDPIYTGFFSDLAVGGYDAVAYFTDGMPVEGKKAFSFEYMGAEWRFANREHLDMFRANPEKYAPQYGGYCAWAMANGDFAKGDPEYWRIVEGKLYLNYDEKIQARWEKDIPGFIRSADARWPDVLE